MQNFNLERTRAPRRSIPWWIYVGSLIITVLIIWAVAKALPGKKKEQSDLAGISANSSESVSENVSIAPPVEPRPKMPTPPPETKSISASSSRPVIATSEPKLQEAQSTKQAGDHLSARDIALTIWKSAPNEQTKREAERILNEVNMELLLTPRMMKEKVDYTVASGDSLEKIAKKFGTTIELIKKSNDIKGSMIRIGDRLRVFQGKFRLDISKSDNDLVLYMNDDFFKRYRVGTGAFNKTPIGDFIINDRIAQPTWWRPDGKAIPYGDPENLLGTHWLSINVKGYGLHGTWEPDTIGKQASAGCIRLLNDDIEQLFNMLTIGTPVTIRD